MPDGLRGPAFFNTRKSAGLTSKAGSSIRFAKSAGDSNTTALPSASNSELSAADRFRMAPFGASVPKQSDQSADRFQRILRRCDHPCGQHGP